MSTHITGKLIIVGNYTEEEQVDRDSPLARAVVVMPREALKAVRSLPMYEDVLIVTVEEWDQLRAENVTLREDKARLDWRSNCTLHQADEVLRYCDAHCMEYKGDHDLYRAAIDHVRSTVPGAFGDRSEIEKMRAAFDSARKEAQP